jgi:hypothetical protein
MPMTHEEFAAALSQVDRFWPHAPQLTLPQMTDWRRALCRFDSDTVRDSVDFWAGAKPKFRPDLNEILSKCQEIEREKSIAGRRVPPFTPPDYAPPDHNVARAGLAKAREVLAKVRP